MKAELDKKTIRKIMKERRLLYAQKTFSYESIQRILDHPRIQKAKMIACYVSMKNEYPTHELIQKLLKDHRVCTPKIVGRHMEFFEIQSLDDLKEGYYGILEPATKALVSPYDIDVMLVPMLAYDKEGYRVGYGGGFYDRYFSDSFPGYKIGLAYSYQYVPHIERNEFDQKLDEMIVEKVE